MQGTIQKKADELWQCRQQVLAGLSGACLGYLQAGKNLLKIKQKQLWRLDGSHCTRFESWVKNELGISKSTAYNALAVYSRFGDILESTPRYQCLDFSHLVALTPHISDKATVQEREKILDLVVGQTVEGVKNQLRDLTGKTPTDGCNHPDIEMVGRCRTCGKWVK